MDPKPAETEPPTVRWRINEDWLATLVGLGLVALVLLGIVTKAMIP